MDIIIKSVEPIIKDITDICDDCTCESSCCDLLNFKCDNHKNNTPVGLPPLSRLEEEDKEDISRVSGERVTPQKPEIIKVDNK